MRSWIPGATRKRRPHHRILHENSSVQERRNCRLGISGAEGKLRPSRVEVACVSRVLLYRV